MRIVRDNLMMPNRRWNRMGPPMPAWFRRSLRRIDPKLALQFMPPADPVSFDGVNREQFPHGVWMICRRLRRSRMLQKRAVFGIADPQQFRRPSRTILRLIKRARNLWRQRRLDELSEDMDRAVSQLNAAKTAATRKHWTERIVSDCRRLNITKRSLGLCGGYVRSGVKA